MSEYESHSLGRSCDRAVSEYEPHSLGRICDIAVSEYESHARREEAVTELCLKLNTSHTRWEEAVTELCLNTRPKRERSCDSPAASCGSPPRPRPAGRSSRVKHRVTTAGDRSGLRPPDLVFVAAVGISKNWLHYSWIGLTNHVQ